MDYLEIIKRKAFRPIKSACISLPKFTYCIEFEDGVKICKKDDVGLREFLCTVQHLEYEIISGNTDHCISSPVGYWQLLGFRANDSVLFRDERNHSLSISFSSPSTTRPSDDKRNDI